MECEKRRIEDNGECAHENWSSSNSCCYSSIRFELFNPNGRLNDNNNNNIMNPAVASETKKKRKREDTSSSDEKSIFSGLISIIVLNSSRDHSADAPPPPLAKNIIEQVITGNSYEKPIIVTHNSSLLNNLPVHSELIHDQLIEKLFVDDETRLAFHIPVQFERELNICRMELTAYSRYNNNGKGFDVVPNSSTITTTWSSPNVVVSCVKPEIKKTSLSGFISVERSEDNRDDINSIGGGVLEREGTKNKITIWISLIMNGQWLHSEDSSTLLDRVTGKDRWCDIVINNDEEDPISVKENSFNDSNENRKLYQLLFTNLEKYGMKLSNLNTNFESSL